MDNIYQRVEILFSQSRYPEIIELLGTHLEQYPEDNYGQYMLAVALFQTGETKTSREIAEQLLSRDPENLGYLRLIAEIDISDDLYEAAESKAEIILEIEPEDALSHLLMARIKLSQNSYDRSLSYAEKALELDSENVDAYNLKIMVSGILGKSDTSATIDTALNLNPDNVSTIANHGYQLVRDGKPKEALERLKYALSLDPTNQMARYAMTEAMKSRFLPYRLFFKYGEFMARLSGKMSWTVIIGAYIGFRILRSVANKNPSLEPFLMPVVYAIFGLFLLTWITGPLMNMYLLSNKYGRLLLDDDDKTMAQLTGISLLSSLVCFAFYWSFRGEQLLMLGILFAFMMIPLGTFLQPTKEKNRKYLMYLTVAIAATGILGGVLNQTNIILISFIGIFIYQWVINGIMIKENARVMD